eukprot:NODE_1384_length_940_cov_619.289562_g1067_i0.p1 GENE.NODE_1384_length_940_cov_619.289562_g1067_i0~~NODE_1384_length_940_cov_619.289562_g1067_i0.p1  ORF type:complete len:228 (-),score=33.45 NODE_1384_length_940_cov_619.289562_g1067_i0:136-819(-)
MHRFGKLAVLSACSRKFESRGAYRLSPWLHANSFCTNTKNLDQIHDEEEQGEAEHHEELRPATVEELHAQCAELTKTTEDAKRELAYALAEIENTRKISRKDVQNAREYALKNFAKDMVECLDNLDRALGLMPVEVQDKSHPLHSICQGIIMTSSAFSKSFSKHGLEKMEITAKETEFDPHMHDALFQEYTSELPSGVVYSVLKSGYLYHGRVLRAAEVGVTCEPAE